MPAAPLTDQQSKAIITRDTSIALSAGAGCGKTFVLTERFLSHLKPESADAPKPADLQQLIAITFTDAAAREMRSRIRANCYDRLKETEPNGEAYWLKLVRAIETARISTIHAFCTSLLRAHAIEANLDPAFGVLEQAEADVLQSETIDDVLRSRLADRNEEALQLATAFGLATVKEQLRELLGHRHTPAFDACLDRTSDDLLAAWQTCFDRDAFSVAIAGLRDHRSFGKVRRILVGIEPGPHQKFAAARSELLEVLDKLANGDVSKDELATICSLARIQGVWPQKNWPDVDTFDQYKKACEELRAQANKCLKLQFDPSAAREAAELGLSLLRLAREVGDTYEATKRRQSRLDFDDLLACAHRLLTHDDHATLRQNLSNELRLLLVDEFQDTDQLQVDLVKALCGDALDAGKLFFVGDFKQSIYRFRGAEPNVFRDLQASIREPGRLPLTINFRSQPAILNFVNALFCDAFAGQYEPLHPNRSQTTPEPAVEFLWTVVPEKKDKRVKGAVRAARAQEARWIARRLRHLLDSKEAIITDSSTDTGTRPLKHGDVAILFRALSDVDLYEAALREYDLDYYLVGGRAFYSQQEIYDVLNLLRAIASPADEISLAGALRSPFFALEDETLFWLVESGGTLNAGLFAERTPSDLSPVERTKTAAAAATLRHLRDRKDLVSIATLLREALDRTGYDAALLTEFLGERKLANLNKLLEQARTADGNSMELPSFIVQLAEFVASEPKEALAATLSESADVIRLMTIHHAKGLEFPLVIVPDLDRPQDFRPPSAALDPALGPLVKHITDDDEDVTTGFDLYCALEKRADAEERTRLLYVACTRAADYLILASSVAGYDSDDLASDWVKLLARQFDLATGLCITKLPRDYAPPHVQVTSSEPPTTHRPSTQSRTPDLIALLNETHDELIASAAREPGAAFTQRQLPPGILPIPADTAARRQFSVSRLTGRIVRADELEAANLDELARRPAIDADPIALGLVVHAALERISFKAKTKDVSPLCERLADELVLKNAAGVAEAASRIVERFVATPRWSQIAKAARVHREVEFLLAWPPDHTNHQQRFLQGYIDCLYQDSSGRWRLVDYKTNNIAPTETARTAQPYEMQMLIYTLAAERALNQSLAEITLHFLRPNTEHKFNWTDATRRQAIDQVNQAIEGFRVQTSDASQFRTPNPEP